MNKHFNLLDENGNPKGASDLERSMFGSIILDPGLIFSPELKSEWLSSDGVVLYEYLLKQLSKSESGFPSKSLIREATGVNITGWTDDASIEFFPDLCSRLKKIYQLESFEDELEVSASRVKSGGMGVEEGVSTTIENLQKIISGSDEVAETHISAFIQPTVDSIIRARETQGLSGVDTGSAELNTYSGGWQKTDQVIIAARPGMGKTTKAMGFAYHASKLGKKVAVVTLEMSAEQLTRLLISFETGIDTGCMLRGEVTESQLQDIEKAVGKIYDLPIFIEEKCVTINDVASRLRVLNSVYDIDLVVVDYLQLISGPRGGTRENEITKVSWKLKMLAKELGVCNLLLSQLSRRVEERSDKRPMLSDLRESGAIEQDADMVIMLYRGEYYDDPEAVGMEMIIRKNRSGGKLGTVIETKSNSAYIRPEDFLMKNFNND